MTNNLTNELLLAVLTALVSAGPAFALEIEPSGDGDKLAGAIVGKEGITLKSVTVTGHVEAAGVYTSGPLGLADGALFTTGEAKGALPPNDSPGTTADWALPGDPLCQQLAGADTFDAARLEIVFQLEAGFDGIRFDYLVGSEEYPEFVGEINDSVGIFIDGVNYALDEGGNPITVNGPFFSGSSVVTDNGTEYDGSTPRLSQQVALAPGEHTVIVVVCDAMDAVLDTGIFLAPIAGCKGDCDQTSWCGDGNTDPGEDCDDGNNVDGDGCNNDCKLEATCGDGKCNGDETCGDCPADCGECPPACGDGKCNGDETCGDCPGDCGECPAPDCGDGKCNGEENCELCPNDCGECPDGYGSNCDACPGACPEEPDYSEVKVGGGPGGCNAAPLQGTGVAGLVALLLAVTLSLLAVRRVRRPAAAQGVLVLALLLAAPLQALEITTTVDGQTLAQALIKGDGVVIKSVTYTGHAGAAGSFTDGPMGLDDGIILTSGSAQGALPPNDSAGTGSDWNLPGDPLCDQLVGGPFPTGDAARLEIVFELKSGMDGLRFDYLVGSEEYPEWVGEINDVAGFFVDGVNWALDGDGNDITINGPFFSGTSVVVDNGTEYDGSTPRLQQQVALSAGEHTLVIVVCDAVDRVLDTGILVAALAGCKGDCNSTSWCGDGAIDSGEDCDDGNNVDGDGCDNTCKFEAVCGDGTCVVDENCASCPADCGQCPPACGDGQCNGVETCVDCETDCGQCPPACGDGQCNGVETCVDCEADCGQCPPGCGDSQCSVDESCVSCPADCGECPPACGDGECNGDETCADCEADCGECPVQEPCGDGVCGAGENCLLCSLDCGKCPPTCAECKEPECEEEGIVVSGGATSCSLSQSGSAPGGAAAALLLLLALALLATVRRPFRSRLPIALLLAMTTALAIPARAEADQEVQIESQFFKPSPFIHDYFTVGTGDIMRNCGWNIGLMLNYQNDPLILRTTTGDDLGALVEHQVTGNVLGAFKILSWLGVGLDVPVVLAQFGDDITGFPSAGVVGVGDIRLVPRARLYQTADGFFTLGAEVALSFPTGKLIDPYMGRNGFGMFPRLLGSLDFGGGGLALNAGTLLATGEDTALNVNTGHAIDTRLGGWLGVVRDRFDLIAELGTQMKLTEPFSDMAENPMEALGGLRWQATPGLFVSAGAGAGLTEGAAAPDFRLFAGVHYASCCTAEAPPPPKPYCDADPDGDKLCSPCVFDQNREEEFAAVCRGKDQCPAEPEDFDRFEDGDGCADADNDRDGICDPWVAEKGLTAQYEGVCRLADKCPDEPEDADGFEDDDGCPEPDNDKDGLCDPWVAEKGLADRYKQSCKPTDKCPVVPETVNSFEDDDGCPDKAVVIEAKKIVILQKVEFYYDETRIKEESFPLLDEVVLTLKDNPQIRKIRIEGHTDERGNDRYNLKLSSGRVETVLKYLAERGIESKRLSFKGYGESKPLVKNASTEEDHQRNRRVEFIIIEMDQK